MENQIDRAIRTMFLRRKLKAIEARKIKYPATNDGRKRFIQDALKTDNRRYGKLCYWIAILLGLTGMVVSFVICLHDKGSFLLALLSMAAILLGIHGLKGRREP
jgi:Sec-independent protein secretion pathway component TatC